MADNVKVEEGKGPSIATDEVGGVQVQRVKVQHGADGSATDASTASPLPVDDDATQTILNAIKALLEGTGTVKVIDGGSTIGVDDNGATLSIDDGGGSVTVDFGSLPAGNNNIGDVDIATIAAGSALIGDVGLRPRTSGGLSIFRSLDLDETEEQVKETAGQVYFIRYDNRATSERFLKFYNGTAAGVTVGTTTPVLTIPMAKESAGHVPVPQGLAFGTAITVAATTGIADNNTGAPAENEVVVNIGYA